jgi:hypothetical protein
MYLHSSTYIQTSHGRQLTQLNLQVPNYVHY